MANKPRLPKERVKQKPRTEQLIPNSKVLKSYWEYLKDGAREGDYFCTAALIILTREQQMAWKDLTDMAVLYRLFREESGKVDQEPDDEDEEEDAE